MNTHTHCIATRRERGERGREREGGEGERERERERGERGREGATKRSLSLLLIYNNNDI